MFSFGKKKGLRNLSKKSSKKKKIILIFFSLVILISLVVGSFHFFRVLKVNVSSENVKCLDNINTESEVNVLNKNIFLLNPKQIEADFKKKYSCVGNIEIKKKYPFEVFLKVNGKRAVFELMLNKKPLFGEINLVEATASTQEATIKVDPNTDTGKNFLVDSEGKVFSKASENEGIDKIEYVGNGLEIGQVINKTSVQNAMSILNKLRDLGVVGGRVVWDGDILFLEGSPQLLFSLNKDPVRQSASLQLILQKAKMDSKEMDKIDLRFDKIIVLYSPKKK